MYSLKNRKVCVAGSSGFLGSWICQELEQRGAAVTGVSISGGPSSSTIRTVRADLRDPQAAVDVLRDSEVLVIAAAVTSGAQVMETNPLAHLLDNALLNASLLRAATIHRLDRVLFISSSTVYPNSPHPMTEDDVDGTFFSKYEVVATMKKASEDFGRLVSVNSPTGVIVVRPGNAYGPLDHFEGDAIHVIPALVRKVAASQGEVEVWGDGRDVKNFIYARDLAKGIAEALERGTVGRTYNMGGTCEHSIAEVVELLLEAAGKGGSKIVFDPLRPSMIPVRRMNSNRAARELGFTPETSLQQGLRETYNWYVASQT